MTLRMAAICASIMLAAASLAQPLSDCIVVTDFAEQVLDRGGDAEDWQPAFQAAAARARESSQPIYVPAGTYPIRQAIDLTPPTEERRPFLYPEIQLIGAGPYASVIDQQVETENCVNWSGPTYEDGAVHGRLENLCLRGGDIILNIKWHNYFVMDSCYLEGAQSYGVYAEGWSSRFLNSIIRWCRRAGFFGGGHFNNCVIRDCYFSRDGVGILLSGVHGSRIEGCGLESCARAAILVTNTRGLTISNSYFEGNGYRLEEHFPYEGAPNTVSLDVNNLAITVHDNIFRANLDDEGALLSIADVRTGHVYDNLFYNYNPFRHGILLRAASEIKPEWETTIADLVVEHNRAYQVAVPLGEDTPGVYDAAVAAGSTFDWELTVPEQ